MREIKFRVWSGGKIVYPFQYTEMDEDERYGNDLNIITSCIESLQKEGFVLMQFTGLKDKNGKDIYEGDIVKCKDLIFEVYWDKRSTMFNLKHGHNITTSFLLSETYLYEVIGNIYENPELLKEA